jgi:hypothetical protein
MHPPTPHTHSLSHTHAPPTHTRTQGSTLLTEVARMSPYSNHQYGSSRIDLAAVADLDGDGADEMVSI